MTWKAWLRAHVDVWHVGLLVATTFVGGMVGFLTQASDPTSFDALKGEFAGALTAGVWAVVLLAKQWASKAGPGAVGGRQNTGGPSGPEIPPSPPPPPNVAAQNIHERDTLRELPRMTDEDLDEPMAPTVHGLRKRVRFPWEIGITLLIVGGILFFPLSCTPNAEELRLAQYAGEQNTCVEMAPSRTMADSCRLSSRLRLCTEYPGLAMCKTLLDAGSAQ